MKAGNKPTKILERNPIMTSTAPISLDVTTIIDASPEDLYDMVSDVTRMGEWSPETTDAEWLGNANHAVVGAKFKGTNTAGPNTWSTKPTVTVAERGQEFSFDVPGKSGPTWTYRFEPVEGGTRVTESVRQQKRSPLFIRLLQKRAGITDRSADLRANMQTTLDNLAAAATAN